MMVMRLDDMRSLLKAALLPVSAAMSLVLEFYSPFRPGVSFDAAGVPGRTQRSAVWAVANGVLFRSINCEWSVTGDE
jgi:hypothetical protein